jgi:molybdopterin molybdotransferase
LQGYVRQAGGKPRLLGIVGDKKRRLRRAIERGFDGDILLITGGVSVGKYDLVGEVVQKLGVRIKFWRVNIKPGKPLLFGTFGRTLVFGLPGNPVSTGVTFLQFVRPALAAMLGQTGHERLRLHAILDEPLTKQDGKRHFVRGVAAVTNGALHVATTGSQSSGMVSSLGKANCLIILPENVRNVRKGSKVEVEFIDQG